MLHECSGQRSPVASGLHDNSQAVPKTFHPHSHTQGSSFCPKTPVHQKKPWSVSFNPNIYSRPSSTVGEQETTKAAGWQEINGQNIYIYIIGPISLCPHTHTQTYTRALRQQSWKRTLRINPDLRTKTLSSSRQQRHVFSSQILIRTLEHAFNFIYTGLVCAQLSNMPLSNTTTNRYAACCVSSGLNGRASWKKKTKKTKVNEALTIFCLQDISWSSSSSLVQVFLYCWFYTSVVSSRTRCGAADSDQPERSQRTLGPSVFPLGGLNSRERRVKDTWEAGRHVPAPPPLPLVSGLTHFRWWRDTTTSSGQAGRCATQTNFMTPHPRSPPKVTQACLQFVHVLLTHCTRWAHYTIPRGSNRGRSAD